MRDWPHSPVHRLSETGTFMVTAGTYKKEPIFRSGKRLEFLCVTLLDTAEKHSWTLQAWACFQITIISLPYPQRLLAAYGV